MACLRQWDIVAGIPSPPKRDYGRLKCGEPDYNYVVHRGGSHPMCVDALNCTCANVYNHLADDLCLAISFGMEICGLGELGVQH